MSTAGPHHAGQHLPMGFLRPGLLESDFPLRILVQGDMVGAIIGRSGSTIKQITQQSRARIDVHRDDNLDQNEKVITINGSPESCSEACFKILDIIMREKMLLNSKINDNSNSKIESQQHDEQTSSANNNNNNNNNNNFDVVDSNVNRENNNIVAGNDDLKNHDKNSLLQQQQLSDTKMQLKILAHNNLIGRLIGRSGNSIKKIMEQTSTKMNISGNSLTECTQERTITVTGTIEQIRRAEKIISSKLKAAYISDLNSQVQAMNHHQQPYLFNNVPLPYIAGPYAQNPILSTLVNSQTGHNGHNMSRTLNPHQNQLPNQKLYPSSGNYLSFYPNITGMPSSGGQSLLGLNPSNSLDIEKETVHLYIPSGLVGAIIGKSGSAIKEMISTSGASIKVVAASATSTSTSTTTNVTPPSNSNVKIKSYSPQPKEKAAVAATITGKIEDDSKIRKETNAISNKDSTNDPIANGPSLNVESSREVGDDSKLENGFDPSKSVQQLNNQSQQQPDSSSYSSIRQHSNYIKSNESYPSTRKVTIYGTPESQWSAQYLIYRKVALETGKSDISLMVEIQVPSHLVGRIIGKAGATVKSIQKQTRTTIRLPDDRSIISTSSSEIETDNSNTIARATTTTSTTADGTTNVSAFAETTVQITGEFQSTQLAQRHIRNLIKERF